MLKPIKDASNEVKFLAGGSDFVPRLSFELNQIPKEGQKNLMIISLANLDLNSISENDAEVNIGSTATFTEILENKIIKREKLRQKTFLRDQEKQWLIH